MSIKLLLVPIKCIKDLLFFLGRVIVRLQWKCLHVSQHFHILAVSFRQKSGRLGCSLRRLASLPLSVAGQPVD